MKILLTGGAGYIGSHTAVELLNSGYHVTIVDNLSNSSEQAIDRIRTITGKSPQFKKLDLLDRSGLNDLFKDNEFDAVIHFAGLKAVGESVAKPLAYYRNNLESTINLCEIMLQHGVGKLIFSSSATVYGEPERIPIDESCAVLDATNPYGRSKLFIEKILEDLCHAEPTLRVISLRYFNPIGAHESGEIGEDPNGIPNNLLPFVSQVAVGKLKELVVFGDDYPTPDGTCIRDYIHVKDLASGHKAALSQLDAINGMAVYNLGTGRGASVLEVIRTFEKATGISIPFRIGPRRAGDIPVSYTDPGKALKELGWQALHSLEEGCLDAWRWQEKNPDGFTGN
ncbi:MAG: UDP-glucose 4-epimerase GalE [Gammaproteobacteria bacterium]|nr:UDP-glucose 4-epimerase GalE [Gammaproteobacteria bacterium]